MSTIANHGFIPEEHAPDPVIGHGDSTPPGKVAIWLFLASEIMFFIAILGTYIVLRSGSAHLFSEHAAALSKPLAGANTLVLIFSSLTMALAVDASQKGKRGRTILCLVLTFLCASGFMVIKSIEYATKAYHYTVVTTDGYVYDGHVPGGIPDGAKEIHLTGWRMKTPDTVDFNINLVSEDYVQAHATSDAEPANSQGQTKEQVIHGDSAKATNKEGIEYAIPVTKINSKINYGPWKNIFYSCYFTLTGIHGLHVIGGMIPIAILAIQAMRGKLFSAATEYVGLYWHFVDLVWIFLFPLLYLI